MGIQQEGNPNLGAEAVALFYFCLLALLAGCLWLLFISEHHYSLWVTVVGAMTMLCTLTLMIGGIRVARERIQKAQGLWEASKSNT